MLIQPILIILLALLPLSLDDGEDEGRRGNALYEKEQYAEAADVYRQGLEAFGEARSDATFSGLLNNLGAALFRQGTFAEARAAFDRALGTAVSDAGVARAAYNAGNTAAQQQELEAALDYYKQALLADPTSEDAKFNYEFVKRQLEQQQQQQQQQQGENENDASEDGEQSDQQQQGDQNQQQNEQQQQEQGENQQQQQGQEQQEPSSEEGQQQQPQPAQPDPNQISKEEAARILQALENEEQQLLRQVQKMQTAPRRVEKDW